MNLENIINDIENLEINESMYLFVCDMNTGFKSIEQIEEQFKENYILEREQPTLYKITRKK